MIFGWSWRAFAFEPNDPIEQNNLTGEGFVIAE
jgi:hypothetical protein